MEILRIIDANLNRTGEGLRVVEEVTRFVLNDGPATAKLKDLRHLLAEAASLLPGGKAELLAARQADADVGAHSFTSGEKKREELSHVFLANIRRVQEGARALEEFTKTLSSQAAFKFKELRYESYTLEKQIYPYLLKTPFPSGLYLITGRDFTKGRSLLEVVGQAVDGGAKVVQLREKDCSAKELLNLGRQIRALTREKGVLFIINDRIDLAQAVDADGVHLGQDDLPLEVARKQLGHSKYIGISTHNLAQAMAAYQGEADYIGVGPIFPTGTKANLDPLVGVSLIKEVKKMIPIPVVAIGGINLTNALEVVQAGADGVAVISAIMSADDVLEAAGGLSCMSYPERV